MYEFERRKVWEEVKKGLGDYMGKRFDFVCRELVFFEELFFRLVIIGRYWGYYREDGVKKVYEIDVVVFDEIGKCVIFGECKWRNCV